MIHRNFRDFAVFGRNVASFAQGAKPSIFPREYLCLEVPFTAKSATYAKTYVVSVKCVDFDEHLCIS